MGVQAASDDEKQYKFGCASSVPYTRGLIQRHFTLPGTFEPRTQVRLESISFRTGKKIIFALARIFLGLSGLSSVISREMDSTCSQLHPGSGFLKNYKKFMNLQGF